MELLLASLITFFIGLIPVAPVLAAAIVGLVLSRKKLAGSCPRAHARATLGWVLLILHLVPGYGARVFISIQAAQSADRLAYANWLFIANLVSAALLLASAVLLLQAILADRGEPATPASA